MTPRRLIFLLGFLAGAVQAQQGTPSMPYSPSVFTDKKSNEWYIEQNGGLQRNSNTPSMISNCMVMQISNQQFYSQQPMVTPDGLEILMTNPQAQNGISISRRITIMDRDGGLRYVDEFLNTSGRDMVTRVDYRHSLNGQAKSILTDTGRAYKDGLLPDESGIVALPGNDEGRSAALLFSLRSPGATVPVKLTISNNYQISVSYTLTIPSGQTSYLVHAIGQVRVTAKSSTDDIAKAFRPFLASRLKRGMPKNTIKLASNLQGADQGLGLEDWFPTEFWGITVAKSDQLVLDAASRLKGTAVLPGLAYSGSWGKATLHSPEVAAIAGPGHTLLPESWLWLRDGQRWRGSLETTGFKFTLISGSDLEVSQINRLVLAQFTETTVPAQLDHALLETWDGERVAFTPEGEFHADSPWGSLTVPWKDIVALEPPDGDSLGSLLLLGDGSRIRVLPTPGSLPLNTKSFGKKDFDAGQIRQFITMNAVKAVEIEEPATTFVELAGDQRVTGRVTLATVRLNTRSGSVNLSPSSIRELKDVTDEVDETSGRLFTAELWGGGQVTGTLEESRLEVEGRGFHWFVPATHFVRLVNPAPVADGNLMRKIGQLIRDLGSEEWKTREAASTALREMGPLARGSLQEALKTSSDAEITRRLEELLADND